MSAADHTKLMSLNTNVVPRTAEDNGIGFVNYNALTSAIGQFYGGTTVPSDTTKRLNFNGKLFASNLNLSNKMILNPSVPNSASAIAYDYNLVNNLSTSGALFARWRKPDGTILMKLDAQDGSLTLNKFLICKTAYGSNESTGYGISGYSELGAASGFDVPLANHYPNIELTVNTAQKAYFKPNVADGATSVAYYYGLQNNLVTTGALHSKWVNSSGNTLMSLDNTGNVIISNDLTYLFRHSVASADSVNVSVTGTRYTYYKINAGLVDHESDSVVVVGDSIKILTPGDYEIHCWAAMGTSGANDKIRVKLYVNNAPNATSLGRFIIKSDGTTTDCQTNYFMWYKVGLARNSWLSIRAANLTGNRAIVTTDLKIYVKKLPE
jgi:hypothetical protein